MSVCARDVAQIVLALAALAPRTANAQTVEPSLALGVAVPMGDLGFQRSAGPVLRGGVTFGNRESHRVRLRLDLEGTWLPGRDPDGSGRAANPGTFRGVSALASLLIGGAGPGPVATYGLMGVAVERLSADDVANPYGNTLGLRAGLGVRWGLRARTMFVEVAPHLALTDFGTGTDFTAGIRVPLAVGVYF